MNISKKITYLVLLLFLSSCSLYPAVIHLPKVGSHELLTGTKDGCDSAFSSRGNSFYRTFFKFSQTPELMSSDEYYYGWYRGYIYCFHLVVRRQFTPVDAFVPSAHAKFWQGDFPGENPKVRWPWDQGVPMIDHGIKFPGQGDEHWNNLFMGCKTIFC